MLTEEAKSTLWECNSASYKITPQGLEITVDKATQKALQRLQKLEASGEPVGFHMDQVFLEVIENCLCNGLSTVAPENIAALTSSIILSEFSLQDDDTYEDNAVFFWFPNYQVRSPIEDLAQYGKVIFTKAE